MATDTTTPPVHAAPAHEPMQRNGRWTGYAGLLKARLKELSREPEMLFWGFAFPLLLSIGLGIAFRSRPVETTSVAIVQGPGADRVLEWLQKTKSNVKAEVLPRDQAFNRFRLGKDALLITAQPDGKVQYSFDPTRPESVMARAEVDDALQSGAGRSDPVATTAQEVSEPGSRYIDFLIPGLLGMMLMNSAMWGVGFGLVEMRQRKLLKRYIATPMRRSDFLLAMASSRLVLMIAETACLLGAGVLIFKLRVLGSVIAILLLGAVAAMSFGGLGLLCAARAEKIEAASGIINLVMMPMWIFSGVFFSSERFPATIQPLIKALPLTAINDALRAVILEGAPLHAQGMRLLVLAVWGGISFLLAVRWFRWT